MENQIKISNPLEQRIFDIFSMFEVNEEKLVYAEDVGEILRFLGCVPTEKDIEGIIKETETEKGSRECEAQGFIQVVQKMIKEGKMTPNSPGKLMKAFLTLNPENLEFITKEKLREIFEKTGESFSEQEFELMFTSAVDPRTGNIDYLGYLMQLMHEPKDSIYVMANKMMKEEELIIKKIQKEKRRAQMIKIPKFKK